MLEINMPSLVAVLLQHICSMQTIFNYTLCILYLMLIKNCYTITDNDDDDDNNGRKMTKEQYSFSYID